MTESVVCFIESSIESEFIKSSDRRKATVMYRSHDQTELLSSDPFNDLCDSFSLSKSIAHDAMHSDQYNIVFRIGCLLDNTILHLFSLNERAKKKP